MNDLNRPGTEPEAPEQAPEHEIEMPETEAPEVPESEVAPAPEAAKFKIGDRTFATQEEAHAYAVSQLNVLETQNQVSDAYRQGIRDALGNTNSAQNVTPPPAPEDDFNEEEYYGKPKEFLKRFGENIRQQTRAEIEQNLSVREQSNQIWGEFVTRHPQLADFRTDIENFAAANANEVQAVIATKGRPAGYDFIALKMKQNFERYANALKPARTLSNGSPANVPRTQAGSVTPQTPEKKASTFADQMKSLKLKKR